METALLAYLSLGRVLHLFTRPKRHSFGDAFGDPRDGGDVDGHLEGRSPRTSLFGLIVGAFTLPYNVLGRLGALASCVVGAVVLLGALSHFSPDTWRVVVGWLDAVRPG